MRIFHKRALLSLFVIMTVLITGMFLSKVLSDLEKEVSRNEGIKVFQQAMAFISKNYVEEVHPGDLIQHAVNGMIESFSHDPSLMNPEQQEALQIGKTRILVTRILETSKTEENRNGETKVLEEALTIVRESYVKERNPGMRTNDFIYSAIDGMIGSLDPHSAFMTPAQYSKIQADTKGEFGGIGIQTTIKDKVLTVIACLEDTPAFRAGIKAGDRIVKVNKEVTAHMSLQDGVDRMRGAPSTSVKLSILRDGWKQEKDFILKREIIKIRTVKTKMLTDSIGYIKINQFQQHTASDFSASLAKLSDQNMKSLIVDLRDNPGGLLRSAVKIASQFIPSGKLIVYTKNRQGKKKEFKSSDNTPYATIPVVVLVNEGSASASEIFAGALKDWGRATIVGTLTFGKGSVQTIVPLKDGSALKLTTARYYTPKGISIQTTGVTPDVVVKPAIRDGQRVRTVIREKDLEGHLPNGQKTEGVSASEETAFRATDDYEDPQLQRAIDLLRNTKYQVASPDILANTSQQNM